MSAELPFYDPHLSYEDNYYSGPFGLFAQQALPSIPLLKPRRFLGHDINFPFGIPAGPLLNSHYIESAFRYGFDLCVYKTVRSRAYKSHPLPNILAVHPEGKLSPNSDHVLANKKYCQPLSITNSFGVPSFDPDIWQPDMAKAVRASGRGQLVIGSFQGTPGTTKLEDDYAFTARLVAETNAPILEANLSCPNEGPQKLLCFNIEKVQRIAAAIKNAVPDKPLLLKLAYFTDDKLLTALLEKLRGIVDGFSTINTLTARPIDTKGKAALSNNRPESGVCGEAIRWAGLDMVRRLGQHRLNLSMDFVIVGVGGVSHYDHYREFLTAGADVVMSATGAMWNPVLALNIKAKCVSYA